MDLVVQTLISGTLNGFLYVAFALGLSLVMGILRIINLAHGAILVLAALVLWQLVNGAGMDPLLMILPVVALFYAAGYGTHWALVQRMHRESETTVLLVFFGLMVILEGISVLVWTTDTKNLRLGYLGEVLRWGGVNIPVSRLVAVAISLTVVVALHLFLTRTLWGKAIRGMSEQPDVAGLVGIRTERLAGHVFAGGIALAALGGVALAIALPFTPQEQVRWLAWSFLVVVIGGLGSVTATFVAGLAVGVIEAVVASVLPFQYTFFVLYALLAVVLLLRSNGLSGARTRAI